MERQMILKALLFLFAAFSPLLFIGFINKTKAWWAGRKGASVVQPYYDFTRLLRKGEVISETTSFVFRCAPSVNIAAAFFALLFIPMPLIGSIVSFPGDVILFAYTLAAAIFLLVLAALDTGSSFEGMGASREVTFSTLIEMAFFIVLGTLALLTNQISFEAIFAMLTVSAGYSLLVKILLVASLFIMLLTEGSRVPVDDPATHLELTMIHEVMILDYSGPDLAFMVYAAAMKMMLIALLIANLCVPPYVSSITATVLFLGVLIVLSVAVGAVESFIARSRMSHVPQFIFLMTALSLTAFAVVAFFLRGGLS